MTGKTIFISIKDYKNIIGEQKVHLDSDKINLIVGKNNIGKSNILKAINLLNSTEDWGVRYNCLEDWPLGVDESKTKLECKVEYKFPLPENFIKGELGGKQYLTPKEFDFVKDKLAKNIFYKIEVPEKNKAPIFYYSKLISEFPSDMTPQRMADVEKKIYEDIVRYIYPGVYNLINNNGADIKIAKVNYNDIVTESAKYKELSNGFISAFTISQEQKDDVLNYYKQIKTPLQFQNGIGEQKLREDKKIENCRRKIIEILQKNADNYFCNFKEIDYKLTINIDPNFDFTVSVEPKNEKKKISAITISNQGQGIKKLINLFYLIKKCQNDKRDHIFLIDEIENFLSIDAQLFLISFLKKCIKNSNNLFFVLTTHSPLFFYEKPTKNPINYDETINLMVCFSKEEGALMCESLRNITDVIKETGYVISTENPNEVLNFYDGVSFLSYILNCDEEILKKLIEKTPQSD